MFPKPRGFDEGFHNNGSRGKGGWGLHSFNLLSGGLQKKLWTLTAVMKLKLFAPWKKSYDKPRRHIKKWRHHFANKGPYSQSYCFSSSQVWMWELDHKEGWAPKNSCFWTVVLKKILESPLDSKEIKPVNPKGNQVWIFTGRTDVDSWSSNTLATLCKEVTHWERPWCWERLRARGTGGNRGKRSRGQQRMS